MKRLSSFFLLIAAILLVASVFVSANEQETNDNSNNNKHIDGNVLLQHSLDAGKTWITRGKVDVANMEFEPTSSTADASKWTKAELQQLRALAQKKGIASVAESSLLVRIVDVSASPVDVHASLAVSPCALVVPRQYTSQLTYIAERYGLTTSDQQQRVASLRLMNPFHDEVCEPTVFKTNSDDGVKLKISFTKATPTKQLPFPFGNQGIEDAANFHSGSAPSSSRRGKNDNNDESQQRPHQQQEPQQEQSFWDKWGTYIMIFVAVQVLSSFFGPKEGPKEGGAKGGKGAPAK